MDYFMPIHEDEPREDKALLLTLATFFFIHNNKSSQEENHNDFLESYKD